MNTVTGCIQAGNFSQAISVAGAVMPGNTDIITALEACQTAQRALTDAANAAQAIANGQ